MKTINFSKQTLILVVIMFSLVLLSSCADVQPHVEQCLTGHEYGFWGGLWHGFIAVWAWIGSWFSDDIAVWAVNNNGGWYTFGFLLGVGAFAKGGSSAYSAIR